MNQRDIFPIQTSLPRDDQVNFEKSGCAARRTRECLGRLRRPQPLAKLGQFFGHDLGHLLGVSPLEQALGQQQRSGRASAICLAFARAVAITSPAGVMPLIIPISRACCAEKGSPISNSSAALKADDLRQEIARRGFRAEPQRDEGKLKSRVGIGINQVAVKQHRGADADSGPATAAMMGLRVTGSCLMKRMVGLVSSRGGVFMKSCRSLPAVKHVFETTRSNSTRTAGSDSARLNASTRPVYRAAVGAFFFSGRSMRSAPRRRPSHSQFVRCRFVRSSACVPDRFGYSQATDCLATEFLKRWQPDERRQPRN